MKERAGWRHCWLCNRRLGFWRALLHGACEICLFRDQFGGQRLPWEDRGP